MKAETWCGPNNKICGIHVWNFEQYFSVFPWYKILVLVEICLQNGLYHRKITCKCDLLQMQVQNQKIWLHLSGAFRIFKITDHGDEPNNLSYTSWCGKMRWHFQICSRITSWSLSTGHFSVYIFVRLFAYVLRSVHKFWEMLRKVAVIFSWKWNSCYKCNALHAHVCIVHCCKIKMFCVYSAFKW